MPADPHLLPVARLALAYAPRRAQPAWAALLALDQRLAAVVRGVREPLLAQIRLAWWRDRLSEDPAKWPAGEPLLARLAEWGPAAKGLAALVDGWEALLGDEAIDSRAMTEFAAGREAAVRALAVHLDCADQAEAAGNMARGWALADLAAHVSADEDRHAVLSLAGQHDWRAGRLPRVLRPLAVLHAVGRRQISRGQEGAAAFGDLLAAIRAGLFGF